MGKSVKEKRGVGKVKKDEVGGDKIKIIKDEDGKFHEREMKTKIRKME